MADYFDIVHPRLRLLAGQINAGAGIGAWCFDMRGHLFYSTCPHEQEMLRLLNISGCLQYALDKERAWDKPVILSDVIGLVWAADYVWDTPKASPDEPPALLVVIGPIFSSYASMQTVEDQLSRMRLSLSATAGLRQILRETPVMTMTVFRQYATMLHYTITLEAISGETVEYQHPEPRAGASDEQSPVNWKRGRETEELILHNIRNGILDDAKALDERVILPAPQLLGMSAGMDLREAKNMLVVHNALCARAAISGGLAPSSASELEMDYRRKIELCPTISALAGISHSLRADYAKRVNRIKAQSSVSGPIQACCDYISSHLREEIKLTDLARTVGYTEYYLTKKFFNEMGIRLADYIKERRIEYAKILLVTSDRTIDEICETMGFSARSYFSRVFTRTVGMSPSAYRENAQRRLPGKESK